ncbi:uncharacterized protein LOC124386914 [Silurus meridionalis]|uniref:Ig-like domain-containing protein n=1 Tax=Silurus meridionalis TaxID=175797 RepID=A0A8T0BIP1_SILME|nr:uncharacterized protein LOC124386914 [Silurus meridionalis]KAF7706904.1 hypothetical protein HF521_020158 [Silurus meridionalis]
MKQSGESQSFIYTGDTITLSCELQESSGWEFFYYKNYMQILNSEQVNSLELTVNNSGETVYQCNARRRFYNRDNSKQYYNYTKFSDPVKITARGSRFRAGIVGVAVGLSLFFLTLMIMLWHYKEKTEKQKSNQSHSEAKDFQSGHTALQPGNKHINATVDQAVMSEPDEAAAESREATYAQVTQKKKRNRNNGRENSSKCADAELSINDVTYAEVHLKPMNKVKRAQVKTSEDDDTIYSELHQNMK